jgi:hypothetical protein
VTDTKTDVSSAVVLPVTINYQRFKRNRGLAQW